MESLDVLCPLASRLLRWDCLKERLCSSILTRASASAGRTRRRSRTDELRVYCSTSSPGHSRTKAGPTELSESFGDLVDVAVSEGRGLRSRQRIGRHEQALQEFSGDRAESVDEVLVREPDDVVLRLRERVVEAAACDKAVDH